MPKILVGWNLAIYKLPRFNVSAPSEHFRRLPEDTRGQVFPQWGSRRVDAYLSVDPKTLTRPRAVKTDRKSFVFWFFRLTKSNFRFAKNHRLTKSIQRFPFFRFKVTRPLVLMSNIFLRFQAVTRTLYFPKLQVDFAHASSYFPHKSNVSLFSTAFENTFEIIKGYHSPFENHSCLVYIWLRS